MTKKLLPKKKVSVWMGLAFVFAAIVVVGYYWYSQDNESKGVPEHDKREIRERTIKEGDHVLTPRDQVRGFSTEKRVPYPNQGDESDDRGKGDSIQRDSLFVVESDDESRKSTGRDTEERPAESKRAVFEPGSAPESVIEAEPEIEPDKPDYSDADPPDVIGIRFDPQQVSPGANVTVYVQATDNLSGVSSIFGTARSPSRVAALSFSCQRSDSDESFVGTLEIPDHAEMGTWYLNTLRVTDKVHNRRTYSENSALLRNSYFEVIGSDSDSVPPEVTAVYLDPSEASGGDKVQVTVEAEDDKSGVARIYGVLLSPSKHARLSFSCRNEDETNVFYGQVTIPEDAEFGHWTLEYLQAKDEAKNAKTFFRTNYPSMFDAASVYVYTSGSDSEPPTLDNLTIYPAVVVYEETVEIIVNASDDISGISSVSGRLQSPSGQARIPFSCIYDQDSQEYKAEVIIPANAEIGLWRVDYILMTDKARNQINYRYHANDLVQQAVFEIIGQ